MSSQQLAQAAPAAAGSGSKAPAVLPNPFNRAAKEYSEPFHDVTTQIGTSAVSVSNIKVPAAGFARGIRVHVLISGGTGGSPVFAGNAPWNALGGVTLRDVGGTPLVGPVDGWDIFAITKWGGYIWDPNPVNDPSYSSSVPNAEFTLWIPIEVTSQDGFGSLANMNAGQPFNLDYVVAADSTVFTTNPTTLPTVRVRMTLEAWTLPEPVDAMGIPNMQSPPAEGTTQFWSKSILTVNSGANTFTLPRVGNLIRNLAFVFYNDASPSVRNSSELPPDLELYVDGQRLRYETLKSRLSIMRQHYGMAPDTGLFLYDFTSDMDGHAGSELRERYLATTQATRLELRGTFAGAGTLHVLTNEVSPSSPTVFV